MHGLSDARERIHRKDVDLVQESTIKRLFDFSAERYRSQPPTDRSK
jgi:hypothetical protein